MNQAGIYARISDMDAHEIVTRGIVNVIPDQDSLTGLLSSGKKLNVYLGIDPTATRIHIGHAVVLRKLQAFVELGHHVIFLIGDFTALIGDTSDKDSERPILTYDEIQENFKTYKQQAEKILDFSKVTVVHNSEWLGKLTFADVVKLCQEFSVGDFVGRTLIRKRLDEGKRVGLHETLYPVMQGFDSFHLNTDIQIGGADQTFNMQAGRALIKSRSNRESYVLVSGYLEGTDGRKMSKSWGNAIWLNDNPNEMFGKVMSLNDDLIGSYFLLATELPLSEVEKFKTLAKEDPLEAKLALAVQIVTELHSAEEAEDAHNHFKQTFQNKNPEYNKTVSHRDTLLEVVSDQVGSNSQAKRLISEGGVYIDEKQNKNPKESIIGGEKLRIGKKTFVTVGNK